MELYFVYIIKSLSSGIYYVGMAMDPILRVKEHNKGKSKFTSAHKPFELVYTEGPFETAIARKREKFLKKSDNKKKLIAKL